MENTTLDITLQGYRDHIKELKKELDTLKIGSEDYKRVVSELNKTQTEYSQVLTDVRRGGEAAANSMNEMKDRLKAMKQEVGNLDVGSDRFKELSKQILETTNKLKELEEKQGTFSRNVGNYTNSIIDAFGKMGVELGGAQKAVVGMTQASTGLKDVMTAISKHPLLTLVMVIVTVLMKIKSAIDQNEEATEALQRGMTAFQPVLNLINKAFGFLAESIANATDWIAQKMPKGLSVLGDAISSGIKAFGWLLEGIVNFATFGPKIWLTAFGKMIEGVGWLSDKLADFVDFLGMDGSGLRGMTDGLQKFIDGASNAVGNLGKNVKSLIDSGADSVNNLFKKWANATETVYKNTERQQKLDMEIRQQSIESAKSEAKQAELQRKIAQSTGEEKLKYMRELKKEIEDNGAREKKIAEETLKLAKERAEWAPNSKEDNDYLAELEANAIRVEASVNASLAGIEKKEQKLEESIKSSSEKTAKEITAKHQKEEEKRLQASEDAFKKWQEKLTELQDSYSIKYDEIATEEEQLKGAGLLSYEQLNDYENQKYEIIKQRNKELAKLYAEMVSDTELDEMKKLDIQRKYQALQLQSAIDHSKHLKTLEDNRTKETEDKVKKLNKIIVKYLNENDTSYYQLWGQERLAQILEGFKKPLDEKSKQLIDDLMNSMVLPPEIDAKISEMRDKLAENEIEFLQRQEISRHEHAVEEIAILEAELKGKTLLLGENNDEVQELEREFHEKSMEEAILFAENMQKIDNKRLDNKKKKTEQTERAIVQITQQSFQSIASIMGDLSSLYEDDINRRLERGEITEEQAEEEFEKVKAMQIAEAITSTLGMALQSQFSVWKEPGLPLYAKIAMSALLGASTLVNGFAQVQKIRNTQFGSSSSGDSGSSGGSGISSIAVSPLLNYETDADNATSLTDGQVSGGVNRVVIVQQDIVDTLNQDRVRTSQSTF